jgi:alpha-glucosidase
MLWNDGHQAGFTTGRPYLPIAVNSRDINVERQERDPGSLLNFNRRLLQLRSREPALAIGSQATVARRAPIVAYLREHAGRRLLVLLNVAGDRIEFDVSSLGSVARLLISTHDRNLCEHSRNCVQLAGNEGVVVELE